MPTCRVLGAEGSAPTRESQNTQPLKVLFRALLMEGGDRCLEPAWALNEHWFALSAPEAMAYASQTSARLIQR